MCRNLKGDLSITIKNADLYYNSLIITLATVRLSGQILRVKILTTCTMSLKMQYGSHSLDKN